MANNVVQLPRSRTQRPQAEGLGLYIRVGRNDHRELLHILASGERSIFGFVIEARYAVRHKDLIAEAKKLDIDVILDPMTQQLALPGGHNDRIATLPWACEGVHKLSDFDGDEGRLRVEALVQFAIDHGFTQVMTPSHLLSGPNDPWLRRDIESSRWAAALVRTKKADLGLVYSLSVPIGVLRRADERAAIVSSLGDAVLDALWLKIDNFGDDASGEKTASYIEGCREFHSLDVPVVADNVGGLPGMAALAFGAVGGIAHGLTFNQSFSGSRWRRPARESAPEKSPMAPTWRVYLSSLDMLLKKADAEAFLAISPRVRAKHACKDTNCCPRGPSDMTSRAARHALHQRAREVDWLSSTPQAVRANRYVEERVRPVSDDVAGAAALAGLSPTLQKALAKKQMATSRFRQVMGHLVTTAATTTVAMPPRRRSAR